ncbi:MAG TPA: SPOR domain-containing protein [Steroidobacteraceae bacterium]|jgi:DedD protein|nr:SPOR domain-containing protein [Steroidobacteraceae bacterium]
MDRRVKERLIGASILGVLVVLVVPELLSGPAPLTRTAAPSGQPEPTRSVTVDLTTSKTTSADALAPPAEASAASQGAAPPPRTPPSVETLPASPRPPAAAENPPPPVERPSSSPRSVSPGAKPAGHAWALQLGVFASRANAERLAHGLKAQGFPVYVSSGGSGASPRYRVRVGPMADRGAATQALAKLQSMGHPGSLVPPGS